MKKKYFNLQSGLLTIALGFLMACGSDDEGASIRTDLVTSITVFDLENTGTAGDLKVKFVVSDFSQTTEFRIVLIKAAEEANLNTTSIAELSSSNYFSVESKKLENEVRLDASLLDMNGSAIQSDENYVVRVLLVNNSTVAIADVRATIQLKDVHPLAGRYSGTWRDNLYNRLEISADLTHSNGTLTGTFYFSSAFISCCAGVNDGVLTVQLDGTTVTSFVYNQTLVGCNGEYAGSGNVQNDVTLNMNFEGTDCEGPHTGGQMLLTKV